MAKTLAAARRTLVQKLPAMPANYASGMNTFFGQDVSASAPVVNYRGAITPAIVDKWERNLKAVFGVK